jgi:Cu(I)/Ag(I) efflux system protein CusF
MLTSCTARAPVALNPPSSKEIDMKKTALPSLILALLVPTAAAIAQTKMDDMKGMDMSKKPTASASVVHKATGTVKKLDAKAGVVTLAHEPVKSMNWPSMTMGFKVKDKRLMDKLTDGKKVEFEFMHEGKDYVVTGVK